jgi:peroxiredoxin
MRFSPVTLLAAVFAVTLTASAASVGDPAPQFTGADSHGQPHRLSDYNGKFVVLEWTNNGCPFTRKHYETGNMQKLQKEWTARGVVWFTILSSAPGKQGYMTASEENAYMDRVHAAPTAAILDPTGVIGRLYEAKTTPDMYVIDPSGKLIYSGAIDDHPTPDVSDIPLSKNYVSAALTEAMSRQTIAVAHTRPYGCGVKYSGTD